jgi:PST family polysaccharide transporter
MFGIVVGQTLFPMWFFQGMEKMKYTTALNIISQFFIALVFIVVRKASDYMYVPVINSCKRL